MLKKIFLILALVLIVLIIVISTRPSEFNVSRSTTISAPAEIIFAQVNDFHNWEGWSPWVKLDPTRTLKDSKDDQIANLGRGND